MAEFGYGRVSTFEQNAQLQRDALEAVGIPSANIYIDQGVSGTRTARPELNHVWELLRAGDRLSVYKLDRLGRNLPHLIGAVTDLRNREVAFRSLTEGFDTATPGGRLLFHVMGALAEFERDLIVERTRAGLEAARARGRHGGRRPRVLVGKKLQTALGLVEARELSYAEIARQLGVSRATLYRAVDKANQERA